MFSDKSYNDHNLMTGRTFLKEVEDDLARGRCPVISFDGHTVLAVGIDKSKSTTLVIMDSWGTHYSLTEDEFIHLVRDVVSYDDPGFDNLKTPAGKATILGDRG